MTFPSAFSRSHPVSHPGPAEPSVWRKNDFLTYSVGHDVQAVMCRGETPRVLPGFVVDFVNSCDEFAALEAHIAAYGEKHAWGSMEAEALRSWLPAATESRLLVSGGEILAQCARHTGGSVPPIVAIGFPTGGARVDLLGRAVASFAENTREHGRDVDFLVADSSSSPAHRESFREAAREWSRAHGIRIRYAGEEEKRRFANELICRGVDADAVEFALFDPLGIGFACGANRNALLLHQTGTMFCSVDDDVVCELAAAPPTGERLKLFSSCDPFTRWLFGNPTDAVNHSGRVDADFVGVHEALLGRSMAELSDGLKVADLDLTQTGDELLRRLWAGPSRVRASFTGHFGDPGIPTSIYYLWYHGENRRRLTADEDHYRRVLAARSVFALTPCAAVGDASTSPGMSMGLDHRELLPPFFPVLHAEDFTYGATLWHTVGDSLLGHAPFAIRHAPRPGKPMLQPCDLGPDRRAVVFEFSHLMRRIIQHYRPHESLPAASRMRELGRHLAALADQPLPGFLEYIRAQVLEHESAKLDYLEQQLRDDSETPEFWREDLEQYLEHVRESLGHGDFDIPFDLKADRSAEANRVLMQELFCRYGRLLEAWPDIVATAQAIGGELDWMRRV